MSWLSLTVTLYVTNVTIFYDFDPVVRYTNGVENIYRCIRIDLVYSTNTSMFENLNKIFF